MTTEITLLTIILIPRKLLSFSLEIKSTLHKNNLIPHGDVFVSNGPTALYFQPIKIINPTTVYVCIGTNVYATSMFLTY